MVPYTVQGLLCYAELCGSLPCCAVRLRCAEISNETIAGKSASERNIHHREETFCTSVGTFMAMTHRSNAFFAHAWGFGTPGPVLRLRFRVWPHSRGGLGGHWHTRARRCQAHSHGLVQAKATVRRRSESRCRSPSGLGRTKSRNISSGSVAS